MGRTKAISGKKISEVVKKRAAGETITKIAAEEGVVPSTIYNALSEHMTEGDVEKFQKAKKAKYATLLAQQIIIQGDPDVAMHNARRFGAGNIVNLEKASAIAEGRMFEGEQFTSIQINMNNLYLTYDQLEREKQLLLGGSNAVIEGQLAKSGE